MRAEFQSKGKYRVQPDDAGVDGAADRHGHQRRASADGLHARATAVARIAIVVTASVEFKDMRDSEKVLWSNPSFRVREEYQVHDRQQPDRRHRVLHAESPTRRNGSRSASRATSSPPIFEAF